jgi:alkylation response protein AidB-like acyl-CoA dehydrogenase
MNFELTDDQRAIQRTARDFLADAYKPEEVRRLAYDTPRGFEDEGWGRICELGWPALLVAEDDGGLGLGVVELAVVQEELGAALAPSPFLSTVAAAALIGEAGSDEQRARWLPGLAAGEARGTVATLADDGGWTAVPDADGADVVVVRDGERWALAEAPGAEPVEALDPTRRLWRVRAEGGLDPLPGDAARAADVIAVALAAESVGVARRAMDMAVEYAKEREQFGRPIGAYQAVSHACAQMLLEVEGARSTVLYAAWALDHEPEGWRRPPHGGRSRAPRPVDGPLAAAMAKAYASDAGWRVPAAALQVHGGIGFTWEHDLHLWLKRGKANAYLWGDAREHRARVAALIGLD